MLYSVISSHAAHYALQAGSHDHELHDRPVIFSFTLYVLLKFNALGSRNGLLPSLTITLQYELRATQSVVECSVRHFNCHICHFCSIRREGFQPSMDSLHWAAHRKAFALSPDKRAHCALIIGVLCTGIASIVNAVGYATPYWVQIRNHVHRRLNFESAGLWRVRTYT